MHSPRAVCRRRARGARLRLERSLNRRDCHHHGVAGRYRDLLAHRRPRCADGIRNESQWGQTAHQRSRHVENLDAVTGNEAKPDALRATHGVHRHVRETPIIDLNRGAVILIGAP